MPNLLWTIVHGTPEHRKTITSVHATRNRIHDEWSTYRTCRVPARVHYTGALNARVHIRNTINAGAHVFSCFRRVCRQKRFVNTKICKCRFFARGEFSRNHKTYLRVFSPEPSPPLPHHHHHHAITCSNLRITSVINVVHGCSNQ